LAGEKAVQLVVVGALGRSAPERFSLGSVAFRVAMHAPCPVLIVRPLGKPVEKVLIGIDGSKGSHRAVELVRGFPLPPETTVVAVHVVHIPVPTFGAARGHETGGLVEEIQRLRAAEEVDGSKILQETAKRLSSRNSVETLLAEGPAALRLLELSATMGVDLLVVASRGLAGTERFLLGGVAVQVCQHAPMSVLVAR
jgi:nucleotide-binding universal stress UspA family protein